MITLYYWPTTNAHKIVIFLEETHCAYRLEPINIGRGDQFADKFGTISPNGKIPAIVDENPGNGGERITLFESGAILQYLSEKTGRLTPESAVGRECVRQWLFWQAANVGPMMGQFRYFASFAPQTLPLAIDRYRRETHRLYAVLDRQLDGREYVVGEYSIADISCFPWLRQYEALEQDIEDFPNVKRWLERIQSRSAVEAAYRIGTGFTQQKSLSAEERRVLFGS